MKNLFSKILSCYRHICTSDLDSFIHADREQLEVTPVVRALELMNSSGSALINLNRVNLQHHFLRRKIARCNLVWSHITTRSLFYYSERLD